MFTGALSKLKLINRSLQCRHFHLSLACQKLVPFILSDIGEGIKEVTVSEWFVKVGDKVSQFDNICTVESDKASVTITSRYDGLIKKLHYSIGDTALVGKPLIDIDTPDVETDSSTSSDEDLPKEKKEVEKKPEPQIIESPTSNIPNITNKALATPAVRRIAMEHKINLSEVNGTGKAGRVMKEDILNYLNGNKTEVKTDFSVETPETVKPLTNLQKVMVTTMTKSNSIPSFNYYEEVDVTRLVQLRKEIKPLADQKKINITFMPFFIKAMSKALGQFPQINASLDDKCENLIYKSKHNIGVAVDTKNGLIVPNVKDVQSLSILGISGELDRLLVDGRTGTFKPADLKGGTITISNIGTIGGTYTRPLILPPELVIVALGKIQRKCVFDKDDQVTGADILYSSWTADHRVVDGATLARFVTLWKYYLETPSLLALDI